ncbi:MAG: MBL fold metallo-hydrolase [Gammaproteobacteria bacterium]
MKQIVWLALTLVCASASAQNITEQNVEKTLALIDKAVAAHGGDKLMAITSVVTHWEDINIASGQSLRPDPPWDRRTTTGMSAIDLTDEQFYTRAWGSGGGFEFNNAAIINGDASYQVNYRAGTAQPIAEPDFNTRSGPFVRVTPALLMRQLQSRTQNAHFLGTSQVGDVDYNVIAFSMAVGPSVSLYFHPTTNQLHRSERFLPGFGLVEYRFNDYTMVEGVAFNQKFELYVAGEENLKRTINKTQINQPLGEWLAVDDSLSVTAALEPDPLTRQKIGEGVYLIGGSGTYAMFVEMSDHVIAVGGTAGLPDRIASLRELVDKPIRYGALTHHHSDHVLAVPAYEEEGATVIASSAHEGAARAAAGDAETLKFEGVDKKLTMNDDQQHVEFIDIGPTAHTEHLLVAWLPKQKILFEADHFAVPRAGPVPPAGSGAQDFAKALKKWRIKPSKIVSAHSPKPGTMDDLKEALEKKPLKTGAI